MTALEHLEHCGYKIVQQVVPEKLPPIAVQRMAWKTGEALCDPVSAAAGCMVCVTAQEMIPEAVEPDEVAGVISIVLGFALMMALDALFFFGKTEAGEIGSR